MSHFGVILLCSLLYVFRKLYGCKKNIKKSKSEIVQKKISDCNGDQRSFQIVETLLGRKTQTIMPMCPTSLYYIDRVTYTEL